MEGIVDIEKNKYLDRAKEIVGEVFEDENLSPELLEKLTIEVMNTCLHIGGDYADENIQGVATEYKENGALNRIKRVWEG